MQAAIPLMVAGSLVQGIGGYQAGRANRDTANVNAINAEREGAAEELRVRRNARLVMGRQSAAQAESGFMPGTGSSLDELEASAINAELDVMDVRRQARGRADAYRAQGRTAMAEGKMALVSGLFGAASAVARTGDYAQLGAQYGYGGRSGFTGAQPAPPDPARPANSFFRSRNSPWYISPPGGVNW